MRVSVDGGAGGGGIWDSGAGALGASVKSVSPLTVGL